MIILCTLNLHQPCCFLTSYHHNVPVYGLVSSEQQQYHTAAGIAAPSQPVYMQGHQQGRTQRYMNVSAHHPHSNMASVSSIVCLWYASIVAAWAEIGISQVPWVEIRGLFSLC